MKINLKYTPIDDDSGDFKVTTTQRTPIDICCLSDMFNNGKFIVLPFGKLDTNNKFQAMLLKIEANDLETVKKELHQKVNEFYKNMTSHKPLVKRSILKSLTISCTEEQIKQIVEPAVAFTSYCMSIERVGELPKLEGMFGSLLPSKRALAVILANKLGRPIDPNKLNGLIVQVITAGGYFRVHVDERIDPLKWNSYNITLIGNIDTPLTSKMRYAHSRLNPQMTEEEVSKQVTTALMKI